MDRDSNVQFGAGDCVGEHWRNFDASLTLRIQAIPVLGDRLLALSGRTAFPDGIEHGDILKGLPLVQESVACIYCSHVLEHLSYEDARVALKNTYRILQRGGVFRLVVPDLEYYVKSYASGSSSASEFLRATGLGRVHGRGSVIERIISTLGRSEHLWMWDFESLRAELSEIGFTEIRRAQFGDGDDPLFLEVERESRWLDCLGIECRK